MGTLSENAKKVTAQEGYEVGYSGKSDNRNPYVPGELHDIWKSNYERGVQQRQEEDEYVNSTLLLTYGGYGMSLSHE